MANRYDIIHIDFQASARGANAAIESIRQEADKCNTKISELKKNIAEAPKNGTDKAILEGWQQELRVTERRFNQLSQAQKELVKGMRALDEGVKMFNDGSLSAMNAAFQKTVNNAAKLAQSKLTTGTKEWRDMGALMQETEQNYARMQRDTDQLIESLQNGGTVFRKTLEDEKKGLQDLLLVLPYMGTEYRKADEQLKFLTKTTDEMIIKERQLKGEIVTTDDARRVSLQLTEKGAEEARKRAAAADLEIEKGKKTIETLEQEKKIREENARASAEAATEYRENQRMYEDEIDRLQREIKAEEERAKSSRNGIEGLRKKAQTAGETADKEIAKQKELDGAYETAQQKVARLREEYEKMQQATASAPAKDPATEAIKTGAEEAGKAIKEKTKTVELDTQAVEEAGKATVDHTTEIKKLKGEVESLTETLKLARQERDKLTSSQEKGAAAAKKDRSAMTAEEAKAELDKMNDFGTIHVNTKGVAKFSNLEKTQQYLMGLFKEYGSVSKDGQHFILNNPNQLNNVTKRFQEKYGFEGEPKLAKDVMRQLVTGDNGGLIKGGVIQGAVWDMQKDAEATEARKQATIELNNIIKGTADATQKATAATKDDTKAQEDNAEAQKKRAVIEEQIKFLEDQLKKNQDELTRLQKEQNAVENEVVKTEAQAADATEKKSRRKKKSAEATKEETEAIKGASAAIREQQEEVQRLENMLEIENKTIAKNTKEYDRLVSEAKQKPAGQENAYAQERGLEKADRYKEKYIDSHKTAAADLKTQIEQEKATLEELIKAEKETAEIEEKTVEVKEKKTRSSKKSAEASKEEAEAAQKLKEKKKELKDAENEEATAKKNAEKQQEKANAAIEKAEEANNKVKTAEDNLTTSLEKKSQELEKNKKSLESLNKANENTISINEENQKLLEETNGKIREQGEKIRNAELIKAQAKTEGIEKTEQAIRLLTEENRHIDTNSQKWKDNTKEIQALQAALDEMKGKPALMLMEERMKNIGSLSSSAVAETKRFWEAVAAGADKGSTKLAEAEAHIKALTEEERKRSAEQAGKVIGDMGSFSDAEISAAVKSFEQLRDAQTHGNEEWKRFNELAQQGKQHLESLAKTDAITKMDERMANLTKLSETALAETKKFYEALKAGAEQESIEMMAAENALKRITELEKERKRVSLQEASQKITTAEPLLFSMSEEEIRKAIDATRQLQQTIEMSEDEYDDYSKAIINAENHLKKYGLEGERVRQKQKETIAQYKNQLLDEQKLSESALRTQEQFWQKLIDDPTTASDKLQEYQRNLEKVHQLQKQMADDEVRTAGEGALERFRNDSEYAESVSATALKEQTDALKKYRDSLPKKENAELIKEIDGYLVKAGASAQKSAEQVMELDKALELAAEAQNNVYGSKSGSFMASPQEIQMATKALEQHREELFKTIKAKRDNKEATTAEEQELEDLAKKLKALKFEQDNFNMSREKMEYLMNTPTKATSLDELREAIKRADGELKRMEGSLGENSQEYQAFAEQVKNAKNVLKEMEGQAKATASAWDKAWSRLKTYVGMYMGFNIVWSKFTATGGDLMDLSDKMGEVRKTTGFTADEVGKLSDNLAKLDTRTNLTGLMEFSSLAGSIGMKTQEQVQGFTEAANMLAVSLPEMGNEASRTLMKIADATGDLEKNGGNVRETLERVGSTIIALRANSAAAAGPITDFVSRVGAVGAQAGISIDKIAALGATVDALGGRVEMSATALSRMIPAIRNNTFEVAKAIGMTEKELKGKTAMEQMVAIFKSLRDSAKGFDTSTEEGMNAMADSVEKALGRSASMQEVMKELNQQGARAGIVFGLLSQNVDTLEKQLEIAGEAYSKNTALMNEYNKMNDTTAAKWAKLKNQLEEYFVGDKSQRFFGGVIDQLRKFVDLITGNVEPALKALHTVIWMCVATYTALKWEIGSMVWKGLVTGLTGIKNAFVALFTVKGWSSLKDNITMMIGITKGYIAAKWQLVTAHTAEEKAAAKAALANNALAKSMNANIIMAVIAAVGMLIYKWREMAAEMSELDKTFQKLQEDEEAAERDVNRLTDTFKKTSVTVESTTKKHEELEKQTEALRKEVDEMNKSTDQSTEAQNALREKTDELEKSEKDLKKATDEMNKAKNEHNNVIKEINTKYSSYLGYMLSEVTNAGLVESAHWRIVSALRAELEQKRLLENQKAIETKYGKDIEDWTKSSRDELKALPRDVQDMIMRRRSNMMAQVSYDMQEVKGEDGKIKIVGRYVVPAIDGIGNKPKQFATEQEALNYLKKLTTVIVQQETLDKGVSLGGSMSRKNTAADYVENIWGGAYGSINPDNGFQRLTTAELKRMEDQARQRYQDQGAVEGANTQVNKATLNDIQKNASEISKTLKDSKTLNDKQIGELGRQLNAVVQSSAKYGGNTSDVQIYFGAGKDLTLDNAAKKMLATLDEETRKKVIAAASRNAQAGTGGTTVPTSGGSGGGSNPYGDYNKVTDDYSKWNGDDLVARRKEMLERVRALANGADVQKVLSEDAKFISEATRKNIKDTKQAIEWYNTERLKIQEALHEKHLTNTGDWMDPKKGGRKASKMVQDEMKYYLDELDAYYTDRKAKIQEARNDEQITEAEAWRRTLQNDAEWQQRRGELMELYTKKSEKVTKESKDRILDILSERTGDSANYILKYIANTAKFIEKVGVEKGKPAMDRIWGDIDLSIEQAFLRQRNAVGKQMDAIAEIINKERPFNGITKNLQDNLTKMGILQADFEKQRLALEAKGEDTKELDKKYEEDIPKRLSFILGEAENAWTTSVEEIMQRMADAGMTAWADEIRKSPKMQEALIAQLHNTYDQIQEAIKKEASLMKKQAENMWNNILLPGGDGKTTVKDAFEKAIAQLGLDQGRVSRANSLINAGPASERVADKLAIKQMQLQLTMQTHYFNLMKKQGQQRVDDLTRQIALAKEEKDIEKEKRLEQDKQHVIMSLRLATTKEQTTLLKQQEEIIAKTEESQARLYKELKEWTDLLASSMQSLFEASNAGNAEYYNERARIALEGEAKDDDGKVKVERYVIIEDAGTSDAEAHYEELTELQKIEREREIEQQNAQAEAWKKVMDDINMKMSETITDHINAMLQNAAVNANTDAEKLNTEALKLNTEAQGKLTEALSGLAAAQAAKAAEKTYYFSGAYKEGGTGVLGTGDMGVDENGVPNALKVPEGEGSTSLPKMPWQMTEEGMEAAKGQAEGYFQFAGEKMIETDAMLKESGVKPFTPQVMTDEEMETVKTQAEEYNISVADSLRTIKEQMTEEGIESINPKILSDEEMQAINDQVVQMSQVKIDTSNKETAAIGNNAKKQTKEVTSANNQTANSTQSTFAKMAAAANMYGIAYQTMSNDNLSATQKFQMFAVQAAGQTAISTLTATMAESAAGTAALAPKWMSKFFSDLGPWAYPVIGATTALLGSLMGIATSKISKSKSEIAQATGASTSSNAKSISAGKLMTGMLTYGEGNVNEFTDPSSLTPGRSYNVDSADGKTYRARYMGADPKTHITNGPEFHLVGERGREAIIDAHTTRNIQLNEPEIWRSIQTLYNGGSLRHSVMRRKGRGMAAFADGNIDEFETMADGGGLMAGGAGLSSEQMMALQASIDRQSDLLERAMTDGIHAYFDVYGRGGLIDSYDTGKKTVTSHGERY